MTCRNLKQQEAAEFFAELNRRIVIRAAIFYVGAVWAIAERIRQIPGLCIEGAMPPDPSAESKLEIGHVLFIDIVGYSKLLIEEQKERLNQLTEIVLGDGAGARSHRRTTR